MASFARVCLCAAAAVLVAALSVCVEAAPVTGTHAAIERYLPPGPPRKGPMQAAPADKPKESPESLKEDPTVADGADKAENGEIAGLLGAIDQTAQNENPAAATAAAEDAAKEMEEDEKESQEIAAVGDAMKKAAVEAEAAEMEEKEKEMKEKEAAAAAATPSMASSDSLLKMAAEAKKLGSMLVKLRARFGSVAMMARSLGEEAKKFKKEARARVAATEARLAEEKELAALAEMISTKFSATVSKAATGVTAVAKNSKYT